MSSVENTGTILIKRKRKHGGSCTDVQARLFVKSFALPSQISIAPSLSPNDDLAKELTQNLKLVDQGAEGLCNSECKTIERACQEIMGYSDTDVAEYIYKNQPSVDTLKKYLCKDLSNACSVKTPSVPKDRKPGEPFAAKPSKDAEMDKILRSMEGMPGAPNMKMYSRDELMNNKFGTGEEADDDDEDDDEDKFPGKLGNILREKESPKKDLKQKILKGVQDAKEVVRHHVTTVSKQIKNWWRGKKSSKKAKGKKSLKKDNSEL